MFYLFATWRIYGISFSVYAFSSANKMVLEHIAILVKGTVREHSTKGVYELTVNGIRNTSCVLDYFDNHELRSKKKKSYEL